MSWHDYDKDHDGELSKSEEIRMWTEMGLYDDDPDNGINHRDDNGLYLDDYDEYDTLDGYADGGSSGGYSSGHSSSSSESGYHYQPERPEERAKRIHDYKVQRMADTTAKIIGAVIIGIFIFVMCWLGKVNPVIGFVFAVLVFAVAFFVLKKLNSSDDDKKGD